MRNLTKLDLGGTEVGDAGLKEIAKLKRLRSLTLGPCVTDVGMEKIVGFEALEVLSIRSDRITDLGLPPIARLGRLEILELIFSKVTDKGLHQLAPLKQLTYLNLMDCTRVTDNGLDAINGFERLERLSLSGTSVTGVGLKKIKNKKKLIGLDLRGPQVNDVSIAGISEFVNLQVLVLYWRTVI